MGCFPHGRWGMAGEFQMFENGLMCARWAARLDLPQPLETSDGDAMQNTR
jgi:hypothetical protein